MSALAQSGHELLRSTCLLLALSGHYFFMGSSSAESAQQYEPPLPSPIA